MGFFDIIFKLTDASIKVDKIGKSAQSIIDYMINEKSMTETSIHNYIKSMVENT